MLKGTRTGAEAAAPEGQKHSRADFLSSAGKKNLSVLLLFCKSICPVAPGEKVQRVEGPGEEQQELMSRKYQSMEVKSCAGMECSLCPSSEALHHGPSTPTESSQLPFVTYVLRASGLQC